VDGSTPLPRSAPDQERNPCAETVVPRANPKTVPEFNLEAPTASGEPSPPAAPPEPAKRRRRIKMLGEYVLGDKLGSGAMSSVYRARHRVTGQEVAVKVLRPHVAQIDLFLLRFQGEARALSRLRHRNIVGFHELGEAQGRHYLVMELIEGRSAGDWVYEIGHLSVADAVYIAIDCARALRHAHQNGLIHRDVKPDNILLSHGGDVKLADLGLAVALLEDDGFVNGNGRGAGTPVYVSPEQARDAAQADVRSDIYSLGCTLYHLLTGQLPFGGTSALKVVLAKLDGGFIPAGEINHEVPPELDDLLARMLAPHPDDRIQSASDLVFLLKSLGLAGEKLSFLKSGDTGKHRAARDTDMELEEQRWYVLHSDGDGNWETRRYTTEQVIEAMEDKFFARSARASLHKGNYKPLPEIPEFREAIQARLQKIAAESLPAAAGESPRLTAMLLFIGALVLTGIGALITWRLLK